MLVTISARLPVMNPEGLMPMANHACRCMVAVMAMVPPEPNCHARVTPSLLSSVAECCGYKSPASGPVAPGRVGDGEGDTGPYAAWGLVADDEGVRDTEGVREAGAGGVATNSVGFGEGPNEGDTTAPDALSAEVLAASGEGRALGSGDVESGDAPPSGMPTVGDGDAAVSGTLTPTEKLMLTTFLLEPCCWMGLPAVDGPVPNTTAVAPEGEMGWVAWARGRVTTRVPTPPACV